MTTRGTSFLLAALLLSASTAEARSARLPARMTQKSATDLRWLKQLVRALGTGKVSRARVVRYLGTDRGADPNNRAARRVKPRSGYLLRARVYPLPHIKAPVAVDIDFTRSGRPFLSLLKKVLGKFRKMPRAPGRIRGGDKHAHYYDKKGSKVSVRVIAECAASSTRVKRVEVLVETVR